MDDLSGKLSQILSDPSSMAQIQNIMGSLGLSGQSAPTPSIPAPSGTSGLEGIAAALGGNSPTGGNADMLMTLTKLAPLLGKVREEDDSTRLLLALKPMLSESRRKKIDESMRILQMMRLLPLLKDSGILSSLLGGLF
ncbi:MAG: hypothetical protein RSC76_00375 [Oscillospiraceae bacterium]